jgi:RHH-type transcriptional regulator, rel operon repressor / antitoxin RelB
MIQFTARLPDTLDTELELCRADIIRQPIEYYLDDIEDPRCGVATLSYPADSVLDWAEVHDGLFARDKRSAAKALAALPKSDQVGVV